MSNLVLIYNWAPWCQPCKALSPIIDNIAETRPNVKVQKVNVDNQDEWIPNMPSLKAVPTLWLMKEGQMVWQASGTIPAHVLLKAIEENQ